ncbi:MAG: CoA pyrophosphatase [Candidatus Contendobacter odensis]|uniref:CoA pyrophosphatase n=1 Tax=Candidatus Contendibacter odensensis TaxID=1400860 RepID=A0A2G6PFK4_9GAMM|nr:MAG: CoA pyrophosphatase [Candidatus Contendobacter odensis]
MSRHIVVREQIRDCLHVTCQGEVASGDSVVAGLPLEQRSLTSAAVLVPLVEHAEGYTVLLTQRTEHLEHHAGQISFPGGRAEVSDTDAVDTALREAEEEIGLQRRHVVEIAGFLDLYQTITGFLVTPVVGFVVPPFELTLDTFEVAEAFEVPLEFVLDPHNHEYRSLIYQGRQRHYYAIPYQDRFIWGATAAILVGFARRFAGVGV